MDGQALYGIAHGIGGWYWENLILAGDLVGLKDSTESLIMAAEEWALSTRTTEAGVDHTQKNPGAGFAKMSLRLSIV